MRTAPIVCPEESPLVRPQAQNLFLAEGLTRRLRRGSMAAVILWGSFAHLRGTKISKGLSSRPLVRPQAHSFCRRGLTRRLRRGRWGCRPDGGSYFLSTRKKVPKKARGTATAKAAHVAARRGFRPAVAPSGLSSASVRCAYPPEKGFYCPF